MNVKRYNDDRPDGDTFSYMPVVFNYGESSGYVATIVRENSDGSFDFGEKAAEPLEGARIHTEIKMRLESADEEQRMEARRITKAFFRFLHETYVQQAGNLGGAEDEEETVVSYPVKWRKETAEFMLEAAQEAGFQHVSGMDEAKAAVAAVVRQSGEGKGIIYGDKPGYLLLIDMGAGTTDLVVCRYHRVEKGLVTEMVVNWPQDTGEPTFGGREIDKMLERYVEEYLEKALPPALAPQAHVIASTPGQAKMWKERNVSVTLGAKKEVNTCAYIGTYRTMGMLSGEFPAFGREKFEAYMESGLKEYARLVGGCLDEAERREKGFGCAGLDLVILTGGHSVWYFAREILTGGMEGWLEHPALAKVRENPYRVVGLPNPQSTVALGLVYSRLPIQPSEKEVPWQEPLQQQMRSERISKSTEDVEATYFNQAQIFLSEKTSDPETLKFAKIKLEIPENEDILYAIGNAYLGFYAVAERGIYLLSFLGGKHILSWAEFVDAEWADYSFVAPSWRSQNRWEMSVPLVITREKGPLKDLQTYLRKLKLVEKKLHLENFAPQKTLQDPSSRQNQRCDKVLSIVRHVIETAPDFKKTNKKEDSLLVERIQKNFNILPDEEIFYVDTADNSDGQTGNVLTERGIYQRYKSLFGEYKIKFMTWPMFTSSNRGGNALNSAFLVGTGKSISFTHRGIMDGMDKLYFSLRGEDYAYSGLAGTSVGKYQWDDSFLSIVERFIREDPIMRNRNEIDRNDERKWIHDLEISGNPSLYYVYKCGEKYVAVIGSQGLQMRYNQGWFLGYSGIATPWHVFLNAALEDRLSAIGKLVWEEFQLGDSLCKLQKLLREESISLEENDFV